MVVEKITHVQQECSTIKIKLKAYFSVHFVALIFTLLHFCQM